MPVHGAVGRDGGGPTALGDEPVVHTAGQSQFVDIRLAVLGEVSDGVVDLAAQGGDPAAGEGAAALQVGQHEALVDSGAAFGAPEIQHFAGDVVEHRQAQVGVGGQTDDITGRD